MKKTKFYGLFTLAVVFMTLHSCVKGEDYYQPPVQKPESDYFDFSTTRSVQLNIDYGFDGYSPLFEVYAQNPLNADFLIDEKIEPVFKAFTDANSSFLGNIAVPSYVDTLYVYSPNIGVNRCLKLPIVNSKATYSFDATTKAQSSTRVGASISIGNNYSLISSTYQFYSLYNKYDAYNGSSYWRPSNSAVSGLYSTVSPSQRLSNESTLGELISRMNNALTKKDNSKLVSSEKVVNVSVLSQTSTGAPVTGAHLDLVFLQSTGSYHNAVAYYYYKTNSSPTATEIKKLPKYFVIPRMSTGTPNAVIKTRLQFFGEDGKQPGTDQFPPGYTVGWMLVANMFPNDGSSTYWNGISTIENRIKWAYGANQVIYSNQSANLNGQPGCISLYDTKSKKIIVGFEDQAFNNLAYSDKSYEDILFYVEADPIEAVLDPQKPEIPVVTEEILVTEVTKGTLAFEDIWPSGGDYDMNDVIVEYESAVTFNNSNKIKKIVDTFRPVNKVNSASKQNAFGYVINGEVGTINSSSSVYYKKEESNQIIVFPNARDIAGQNKTFTIVREFNGTLDKSTYKRDYNPFIVINYRDGVKNRVEVHLPKYKPTTWANIALIGTLDDAYFVHKNGQFPFAIDLPVVNLTPVTEKISIGSSNEYPKFTDWAKSFGKQNTDWFLFKK